MFENYDIVLFLIKQFLFSTFMNSVSFPMLKTGMTWREKDEVIGGVV